MLRINNIKISPSSDLRFDRNSSDIQNTLKKEILKKLRLPSDRLLNFRICKQSVDARKKADVKVVFSVEAEIKDETAFFKKNKDKDISRLSDNSFEFPDSGKETQAIKDCIKEKNLKVAIVGTGPAGLFCALKLAEAGLKPLLLERGEDVEARIKSVNGFWQGKPLNISSNVQFGEGGAGTFSDGKLNTMVREEGGRMREVYRTFVKFGADESILYINKPHIGTDKLIGIVKAIREKIIELGGEVRFSSQVTDIRTIFLGDGNIRKICGVVLKDGSEIECDCLVLAPGHSARDTFQMLENRSVEMEQKPFAIGVRVQHPRDYIDRLQYGDFHRYLPAADYKLTYSNPGERGVYSFCMCPGGYVVNASSESGRLAVNGMSYSGRDSDASNSAIVVQISTSDFPGNDTLAGIRLQQSLEEKAFGAVNGKIPVQFLKDFVSAYASKTEKIPEKRLLNEVLSSDRCFSENAPVCKGKWEYSDLNSFLPGYISESMLRAFPHFGNLMRGFNSENTLLLGLESRTSSPVRILRGENLQSRNISGLFPCGEGAGYAGGITSAAMDGMRVAEAILCLY